jgi:hypothetical protein
MPGMELSRLVQALRNSGLAGMLLALLLTSACGSGSPSGQDTPLEPASAPTTSSISTVTTTTRSANTPDPAFDVNAFNAHMILELEGTSYLGGEPWSRAWDISLETMQWAAVRICDDLAAGQSGASIKTDKLESEKLGDPELDRDVPVYVDAVFFGATTFICPEFS